MQEILVSIITGFVTIIAVVIQTWKSGKKLTNEFTEEVKVARAVTDTKIEELTREVREHNNFAKRMPVLENEIEHINGRLEKLEEVD